MFLRLTKSTRPCLRLRFAFVLCIIVIYTITLNKFPDLISQKATAAYMFCRLVTSTRPRQRLRFVFVLLQNIHLHYYVKYYMIKSSS